jgi:alpha-glucosidase
MKQTHLLLLAALLLFSTEAAADRYTFLGSYDAHSVSGRELTITCTNNVLRLTLIDSAIVRVQVGKEGLLEDTPSYAVTHGGNLLLSWVIEDNPGELLLGLPGGIILVQKFPLRLRFMDELDQTLAEDDPTFGHAWDGKEVQVWRTLHDDEKFFGLGANIGDLDKRGSQWVMWNTDVSTSIPFFIGVRGIGAYGTFFDNSHRSVFNLGAGNDRVYSFGAEDGAMNYYFIFGPAVRDVVRRYTLLTGRMPLPPLWSLGYQQSRRSYFPEYEIRDIAQNFRQRRIPADVLYLDIRYMDHFKVFTWDSAAFGNPAALCADLEEMGFKIVPSIDPAVKVEEGYSVCEQGLRNKYFIQYPDGKEYRGETFVGWCHFPDFTKPGVQGWWGDNYGDFMDIGIDGFWNDRNEPGVRGKEMPSLVEFDDDGRRSTIKKIHNVYGHFMAQGAFDGMQRSHPKQRPFILTQTGFAGTQRYAALGTSGGSATFDNLKLALRRCQGVGLSGIAFTGPEIGGFTGTPSHELYTRWIEACVFAPLMRMHAGVNTSEQEPWSFGAWTEDIVRNYIGMRYEFLPYIYNEFRRASQDGTPFMRPLFHDFQDDAETFSSQWQHSFMAGPSILVAPVLDEGRRFQEVYLPPGRWLDPWTGDSHEGGTSIIVDAPLERLPYFYRGGAIIPRREVQQFTGEKLLTELIVDIVPADSATYTLYLDAGDGLEYVNGTYDEIRFSLHSDGLAWIITIASTDNKWCRALRSVRFRLLGSPVMPRSMRINDEEMLFETPEDRERAHVVQDTTRKRFEISLPFQTGIREIRFEY